MGVKRHTGFIFFFIKADGGFARSSFLVTAISGQLSSFLSSQGCIAHPVPWETLLPTRFESAVWMRGTFKNKVYFLVTNPFLISFQWWRAISGRKCGWYCIYRSLQGLARSSSPWRNSSRNAREGWSLSHHPRMCGTTGKWGLKGCATLAQFQDPNICDIHGAGRLSPALLGFVGGRAPCAVCPSPQSWGFAAAGLLSNVLPSQAPGRKRWAVEPQPVLVPCLPPPVLRALRRPRYCSPPNVWNEGWGTPMQKKKHSCLKNQRKSCIAENSLWERHVA